MCYNLEQIGASVQIRRKVPAAIDVTKSEYQDGDNLRAVSARQVVESLASFDAIHLTSAMSTSSESYYLKEVFFKSSRPNWHERYLTDRSERITSLLRSKLGNAFWQNYATVRRRYELEGRLLMRIKSVGDHAIVFSQIWQSESIAEQFRVEGLRGVDMMKLLVEEDVTNTEVIRIVNDQEVLDLITEIRKRPHIIQVLSEKWRTDDMVIGDPLKRGDLYLPFAKSDE